MAIILKPRLRQRMPWPNTFIPEFILKMPKGNTINGNDKEASLGKKGNKTFFAKISTFCADFGEKKPLLHGF